MKEREENEEKEIRKTEYVGGLRMKRRRGKRAEEKQKGEREKGYERQ